ncbi:MAG: nitroreductase family deazaflavin-dependent oxidoreductase [Actinomycetota bacterium]|nr:nitroreductase family deazaflavin-dependent oxidoreductase [Actinomycetota bacterium]
MVLPRWLARANRKLANPILRRIPNRFSPFATVYHVGRRSGVTYVIPLAAFRTPTGFVLTPTYGPDTDWVRNTLTAGSFALERRGRRYELGNVRLVNRTEACSFLPTLVRFAMRLLKVQWFVMADEA